jgi:hypothetical protein
MAGGTEIIKINNLHVHCKDLAKFYSLRDYNLVAYNKQDKGKAKARKNKRKSK